MPSVGAAELLLLLVLVLVLALMIFGPKRVPGIGRSLGSALREIRGSVTAARIEPPVAPRAADKRTE